MLLLRREYRDGAEPPEIVLLHAEVARHGDPAGPTRRLTRVVVPSETPGRRVAHLPLPEPAEGERIRVRYRYSTVRGGEERYSSWYEVDVPSDDAIADLYHIPEEETSNLPPAPGRGHFRLVLPLGEGERASGPFRFGFGAMRKKPSPSLCRASIDAGYGPAPVIEAPEALSVLKNRPMPYFLYHVSADGKLRADKIACARITFSDSVRDRRVRPDGLGRFRMAGHEHLPHGGQGVCVRPGRRPPRSWRPRCRGRVFRGRPGGVSWREGGCPFRPAATARLRGVRVRAFGERGGILLPDCRAAAGWRVRGAVAEPGRRGKLGRDPLEACGLRARGPRYRTLSLQPRPGAPRFRRPSRR